MICDCIDALIGCHECPIRSLETWAVEVGGVGDGPMEASMGLADLNHQLIEGLAFVENPADLVDGVPVRRDSPDWSAYPNRLDTPGGCFVKVDEVHEHIPGLPPVDSGLTGSAGPVEVDKGPVHHVVQVGQSGVREGHGVVS